MATTQEFIQSLKYNSDGLIPAVVQDVHDKSVLMVAYMSPESLERTLSTGQATYYSRSRQKLWLKGETSGHLQHVQRITFDCDRDTLILHVKQVGVACHEGYRSCFYREAQVSDGSVNEIVIGSKE